MIEKKRILVVDDDPDINRLLQFALISEGFDVSVAATGLTGIETALSVRRLRATPTLAHIPIIMLTARGDVKDKLAGFEVGADDYIVKPVILEELLARIKALFTRAGPGTRPSSSQGRAEGQVWTLFSLKGGVGTSSLAVNLAIALRQDWADTVALADLNLDSGAVESMLNLPPSTKLASPETLSPLDLNEDFIRQLLRGHQSKIEVLTLPNTSPETGVIGSDSASRILALLSEIFQYVVVDTSSNLGRINCNLLELSDLIVVVLTSDINSWKACARTLDAFRSLGISLQKVVLVYNNVSPIRALTPSQAESFFRQSLAGEIPYGGTAFLSSINVGVPLSLHNPTQPSAVAIKEFTKKLVTRQLPLVDPSVEKKGSIRSRSRSRFATS